MKPLFRPTSLVKKKRCQFAFIIYAHSPRRADEPASYCRRYPPNAKHSAEGAMRPLFRPTSLYSSRTNP